MMALATPFGSFISEAIQSTTKGLFDVNKLALDSTGLINIDNQEFNVPDMNHGATQTPTLITFTIDGVSYSAEQNMFWEEWIESEYNTLPGYNRTSDYGVMIFYFFNDTGTLAEIGKTDDWVRLYDSDWNAQDTIKANGAYGFYPTLADVPTA